MKSPYRLYFNADKSKLILQGDPAAVTLAYGFGDELATGDEAKLPESKPLPPEVIIATESKN